LVEQPSLKRLAALGLHPSRKLGQNFLIDSNILAVIGELAELSEEDNVLEIGGGLGVLSEYLAERVSHLHVVEIDRRLQEVLADDVLKPFSNTSLHRIDAVKLDLQSLSPSPSKYVGNLPYSIAAKSILQSISDLPELKLWVAMTQREVGERLAAGPGDALYGVPSVLAQLACRVEVAKSVSRTVFTPVPNVDSVLMRLVRTGNSPDPEVVRCIKAAFAHRRKSLVNSAKLQLKLSTEQVTLVREVLVRQGLSADVRAERLTPQQLRQLFTEVNNSTEKGLI